jgi:Tfp pilus assembly protein PilF
MGIALNNLGSIALEQNNLELARAYFEQSLKINYEISARMMLAYNLSGMAQVLNGEGQAFSAAQVQGATNKLLEEMGAPLEPYEQSLYEKTASALKQALGEGAYQQAFEAGKAISLEQTVDLALRKEVRVSLEKVDT